MVLKEQLREGLGAAQFLLSSEFNEFLWHFSASLGAQINGPCAALKQK